MKMTTAFPLSALPACVECFSINYTYFPEWFGTVRKYLSFIHIPPHTHTYITVRRRDRRLIDRYYCLFHIYHVLFVHLRTKTIQNSKTNTLIVQHTAFHL